MLKPDTYIDCPHCDARICAQDKSEVLEDAIMDRMDDTDNDFIECPSCYKSMEITFEVSIDLNVAVTVEKELTHTDVKYKEWIDNGRPAL